MQISYGVTIADTEAQIQLLALTSSMFPITTKGSKVGPRVGASITPTSGQLNSFNYQ